ncbi:MAG: UDP-galactopyranose mutase [Alicyclobacillus sp.]|nr:UDP-galactopyranose mutase [Alicyclobacillus sp.]
MAKEYDFIIVGSGFAGAVIAEQVSSKLNKKVLIVEKRNHIAGNAYDCQDEHGVLIHKYGPHIFHTRSEEVWNYVSQFTDWNIYHHRVLAKIDGIEVPIPFNLNSIYAVFPPEFAGRLAQKLIERFGFGSRVPILKLRESNEPDIAFLAQYVYDRVFLNYTVKQWGVKPEELSPSVTGRVPVVINRDDRYFQDRFQGIPKQGYTKLFERMLDQSNISIMLNTDYRDVINVDLASGDVEVFDRPFNGKLVYTGPVDYFFDYKFGALEYRSLSFKFEHYDTFQYQTTGTVNYPNDYGFTRITEFKHLTLQTISSTTIVKEYPTAYKPGINIPYYPVKNDINAAIYRRYFEESKKYNRIIFVGRLAEYQYYDMDAVVSKALRVFRERLA